MPHTSDPLRQAEDVGEALAGAGIVLGGVRAAWRRIFGTRTNGAKNTLDTLAQRVDNIDEKVDTISENLATLTGEFRGYLRGRNDRYES